MSGANGNGRAKIGASRCSLLAPSRSISRTQPNRFPCVSRKAKPLPMEQLVLGAPHVPTKRCTKCGIEKPLAMFYAHKGMSDGLRPDCRTCCLAREKVRNEAMTDEERAAQAKYLRSWHVNNRGKVRAYQEATRDKRNARRREQYATDVELRERLKKQASEWHKANPQHKFARRLRKFGLTVEAYEALLDAQGHRCAICRTDEPGGVGRWHVDHDHGCCPGQRSCGKCIRGLLCSECNLGLGKFRDDPERLCAALAYLRSASRELTSRGQA